ncbi:MAG TPA: hypothetical protein VFZ95_13115 [Steroidobacteraceae bacterium]
MKTNKHPGFFASLAIAWLAITLRAHAGPEFMPNMVVESNAPGLARLEVLLSSKEWNESRRYVFEGKGSIAGGIALPEKYGAEYSITAYDAEGNVINLGKGPIPPVASLDKPLDIALPPAEKGEGLLVTVNSERIALEVQKADLPDGVSLHAELTDPAGNPAKVDPEQLYWQLSDGRYLDLRRGFDPRDIDIVPHKGFEFAELCPLEPVATVCTLNGHCKPIRVCSDPWVKISAGNFHTCAIKQSGALFCWGANGDGQLGAQTTTSCGNATSSAKCSSRPVPVVCPAGAPCRFTQVAAGQTLTVALDVNGDAWWWGRGLPDHHKVDAQLLGSPVKFSMVAAGFGHGCALAQSRQEIWCWGANGYGETGVANGAQPYGTWEVPDYAPARIMVPLKFRKIVAGGEHTCAIGNTGVDVVCWGRDDQDQSSGPNSTVLTNPGTAKFYFQKFGGLVSILDVSTSASSTCVTLGAGNGVKCWGEHFWRNVASLGTPDLLTVGLGQICELIGQQAKCLGSNNWGELGINSMMGQGAAINVNAPPALYADLAAGSAHTCGITPDGNAFCWGRNYEGQVGNGGSAYSVNAPVQVSSP